MECPAVADIAIEDLVEQGDALFQGDRQADLNQRPAAHAFFVVTELGEGALLAIQVGVGHIVDHAGRFQVIALLD